MKGIKKMGRRPTKANNSPLCQSRLAAAKFNEKFYSKEYVSEQLGVSVSTLSDYELGITKVVPPDMILKMADLYNAPELKNIYCREICPLGCDMPEVKVSDLDRITVRALAMFRHIAVKEQAFLEIAADGVISEDERAEFESVMESMDELVDVVFSLKAWAEKNMERK